LNGREFSETLHPRANILMYKTIGILTGGGDAPGLNAVIALSCRRADLIERLIVT
jgi:hypothetical protein